MFPNTAKTAAIAALVLAGLPGVASTPASASPLPLVIGVDHVDQANQQPYPPFNRLFEYTDFFSRSIMVHEGDTIDFQTQPASFHIVALARDEAAARRAYPSIQLDPDDPPATGTGLPKIVFGPGNFPVTGGSVNGGGVISTNNGKGPPVCGAVQFGQAPCRFNGGGDVEVIGPTVGWSFQQQPTTIDQNVVIDAAPGSYTYFDMLHPGMSGTLKVVPAGEPTSTQADIDARSAAQFAEDQAAALAVEGALNHLPASPFPPGQRVIPVFVGASASNDHVAIDEILPNRPIDAVAGDRVLYLWADDHAQHTIGFANTETSLPEPFGYDCTPAVPTYQQAPNVFNAPPPVPPCLEPDLATPEPVGDPGNAPVGRALHGPGDVVDSGLLIGSRYGARPSSQIWWVALDHQTTAGAHTFFCAVHPWMQGVVNAG